MPTTVRDLLDDARIRHWSFEQAQMPEGALLRFVHGKQRELLLRLAEDAEGLVSQTQEIATVVEGLLVGMDSDGSLYVATTTETGWPVLQEPDGSLYIDPDTAPISYDPWGEDGDVYGLPLPPTLLRLTHVGAALSDGRFVPITVVDETVRTLAQHQSRAALKAFVNGNRLVPIRYGVAPFTDAADSWGLVTSVQLSFIAAPALTALTDALTLPAPFLHALTAAVAEFLATASKDCPEPDRRRFERQRAEAEAALLANAGEVLQQATTSQVVYRRR